MLSFKAVFGSARAIRRERSFEFGVSCENAVFYGRLGNRFRAPPQAALA